MAKNRLVLALVAFSISFSIGWLTNRDAQKALATGLTTVPAVVAASVLVDRPYHKKVKAKISALKRYIRTLQKRQAKTDQAYAKLAAEAEYLLALTPDLTEAPFHPPLQLPASPITAPKKPVISWDLSTPFTQDSATAVRPHELPTEIQAIQKPQTLPDQVHQSEEKLNQVLADATTAKRKIEANLKSLQTELNQLQTQVTTHRQTRDKLVQELTGLEQQKQRLEKESKTLQKDVDESKRFQKELDQYLSDTETIRKELDRGVHPLQTLLKQLQTQVGTHQEELHQLENQINERRKQKDDLERQLDSLSAQLQTLKDVSSHSERPSVNRNGTSSQPVQVNQSGQANGSSTKSKFVQKELNSRPAMAVTKTSPVSGATQNSVTTPNEPNQEKGSPENSDNEWDEFLVQLPEYEFQVLKAIAEQNSPAAVIKKIAEDNLTMPELLIDSINERALETVGDIIIEPGKGAGSAAIAREHLRTVKKLIKSHEF